MSQRRDQLLRVKLKALMADHGLTAAHLTTDGVCAAFADGQAWVLLDGPPGRGLGGAIAYATSRLATELHVLAETGTGILARRAEGLAMTTAVWHVADRQLIPAVAEPLAPPPAAAPAHLALFDTIRAGGAVPVVEHGVVVGEVDGLEVCRVVDDPATGAVRLEVGVGSHDREIFQMLHGDRPTVDALTDVVQAVAAHRRPGAPAHPLNLLAGERALRQRITADPGLVGATSAAPANPPVQRTNIKDATPCVAVAQIDGHDVAVVCSIGIDLDVVPFADDARRALGLIDALVAVPQRDALAVQRRIGAAYRQPIAIVGLASS